MKITLFAPSFETPSEQAASYPLALAYLGTVLENESHKITAYDFIHKPWEDVKDRIKEILVKEKPEIVGVSCMTTNRTASFEIAKLAKSLNPYVTVILGGVHSSLMYKQILEKLPVDFVVIGEAEETIVELLKELKKKKPDYTKIKGIAFKNKNQVIKTDIRPYIKDLDKLPFPNHHYFEDNIKRYKTLYVTTSRGCPFACKFCSTSVHWGRVRRQRSVDNVIEEIKTLKDKYPYAEKIVFNDDEFILNKGWAKEFCSRLIKENLGLKWWCCVRVTSVDEEIVSLMKKAGCFAVTLGIESGSPKILNYINKNIDRNLVKKAFDTCEKYGLPAGMFLMVGLPGENSKTIKETISLMKEINSGNLGLPGLFQVYPGNETYNLAKQQGFITDDYWITDKYAPFYTYEHSKYKLLYWSLKISFFHKLYRGDLVTFLLNFSKEQFKPGKIKRIFDRYVK